MDEDVSVSPAQDGVSSSHQTHSSTSSHPPEQDALPNDDISASQTPRERAKPYPKSDVGQFFDLEAQVDSDEEEYESDDDDCGFIDDKEIIGSYSPGMNVLAQSPTPSAFLEHLEVTYGPRDSLNSPSSCESPTNFSQVDKLRLNNNDDDWIGTKLRRSVMVDDWTLYRIKCLPNSEFDVIRYLLTERDLRNELRAAFYNRDEIGVVYLEACFSRNPIHGQSLLDMLSGLADVRLGSIRTVPEDAYHISLRSSSNHSHAFYSTGDWVTVGHGLYKDDVGLVTGYVERMGTGNHAVGVLLVPRLAMKFDADKDEFEQTTRSVRKRKRSAFKPRPTLFSLEKCGAHAGELVTHVPLEEALTEFDYRHKVLGHFSRGLAIRYYPPKSITFAIAIPQELLQLFRESVHPIFREAPLLQPDNWLFLPGEKVAYSQSGPGSEVFGTVKTVNERGCEIECEEGLQHVSTLQLRKVIVPGDFVRVLHGPRKDTTGLVVAVTVRRVGLISDYDKAISHWIDINTVTLTDSSRLVQANFPWKNVEVRVLGGFFQGFKGVVKNVWPDGHGSLQVSIFIPVIHHSLEVDYTEIVEYSSHKSLPAFAPIPHHLSQFFPNQDLEAMKTGKKPWIGARVKIVQGPWKGYRGVVLDVDIYKLSREQVARRASGVKLSIELAVVTPTVTHPRYQIDYDFVREASTMKSLAHAIRPNESQSFFMPSSNYKPSKDTQTSLLTAENGNARSRTPEPDDLARSFIFTGVWHPRWDASEVRDQDRSESIFRPPPDYFSSSAQGGPDAPVVPDRDQNLWIFHPKLVGIPIRVDLKDRKGMQHVKVMPREGGGFKLIQERPNGGEPLVVWTPDVSQSKDRPKPKTEKSLMVIVKGSDENIGKLVRRIHHFYKGSKLDRNLWFTLGVVQFLAETGETLTSERIESHPDDLEKVQESMEVRKRSALVMAAARDEFRFQGPEVRP